MNTKFKLENFKIDFTKPIGKGTFGEVYKATEKNSGKDYAIKKIPIDKFDNDVINNMLLMNNCENSIKYYGYFKEKNFIYLIMELCDCNLSQMIEKKKLKIKEIKELLEQLNNAFKTMHKNSIIHRNIKPENILIKKLKNNNNLYKLGDYESSKQINKSNNTSNKAKTNELNVKNNLNNDISNFDLWFIGILIHKLCFGKIPKNNVIQKMNNKYLDDLIQKLLIKKKIDKNNNNGRFIWEEYFNHNFFKNEYIQEIENLKKSLEQFNKKIKVIINLINDKLKEFNNLINKEIKNIFTNEFNENMQKITNLIDTFNVNNDENKYNEMFTIFNKSIIEYNEILEYKLDLDQNILYQGQVIKGTNIKNGKGIEYILNNSVIKFIGEYLNGEKWNRKRI